MLSKPQDVQVYRYTLALTDTNILNLTLGEPLPLINFALENYAHSPLVQITCARSVVHRLSLVFEQRAHVLSKLCCHRRA